MVRRVRILGGGVGGQADEHDFAHDARLWRKGRVAHTLGHLAATAAIFSVTI